MRDKEIRAKLKAEHPEWCPELLNAIGKPISGTAMRKRAEAYQIANDLSSIPLRKKRST
jgi:hypothetical protein